MKLLIVSMLIVLCTDAMSQQTHNPVMGTTTGRLPFLEYGLGDDRLGGAKMTYLDSNIVIRVVDSVKDDYKVQLSTYHSAWLAKTSFKQDSFNRLQGFHLTGNWKVFGDNKYDYVTVSLDERLPYRSIQDVNPSRIVIDVFGVTSNTNWITQLSTAKEIKNAYYEQTEDDVFRIVIELRHQQHWGYFIYYDSTSTSLVVRVKRQPKILTPQNLLVAIDAGHGGSNTGAGGETSGF